VSEPEYQANDPKQVKSRTDKHKLKLDQQHDDLKELLQLPSFRRYVWRHMNETCLAVGKSAYHPNGSQQSFNGGVQSVGAQLWIEVEQVDPLMIPKMMTEYFEAQKS